MPSAPLCETRLPGFEPLRGKVRDVYDLGDHLLLVATDRISAFDWILPVGIPDKGRVLTQISRFWFGLLADRLGVEHHLITCDLAEMPLPKGADLESLRGRTMLCRKTRVVPFECVARGYLAGSGWKEYQADGAVCGIALPEGLLECARFERPIFTPATKAELGEHDENVPLAAMVDALGEDFATRLRDRTLEIYDAGAEYAAERGIVVADTKLEFGVEPQTGELLLIDEVLTPDSSRFWPQERYAPGGPQASFDKQFVRDWLLRSDWDRKSPPPELPEETILRTRAKYVEAYERLTGETFDAG